VAGRAVVNPYVLSDGVTGDPFPAMRVEPHLRASQGAGPAPRGLGGAIIAASSGFGAPAGGAAAPNWTLIQQQAGSIITGGGIQGGDVNVGGAQSTWNLNADGTLTLVLGGPGGCCG
jgi:hypothetical protein